MIQCHPRDRESHGQCGGWLCSDTDPRRQPSCCLWSRPRSQSSYEPPRLLCHSISCNRDREQLSDFRAQWPLQRNFLC